MTGPMPPLGSTNGGFETGAGAVLPKLSALPIPCR